MLLKINATVASLVWEKKLLYKLKPFIMFVGVKYLKHQLILCVYFLNHGENMDFYFNIQLWPDLLWHCTFKIPFFIFNFELKFLTTSITFMTSICYCSHTFSLISGISNFPFQFWVKILNYKYNIYAINLLLLPYIFFGQWYFQF